ncbi:hypothetical protein [Arthrobacter sp. UYEF3]|uniref:hypothetical protein n=1 Tax=Arthrobacter sp. UYEF3 TaxID=1756365 RepID=UPI00339517DB
MPPTSSSTPIEAFASTGPAEWWQILAALGPLAVLLGATVAGVIGWRTLKQKSEADNRAEWWRRTQWALDAAYSGNTERGTIGLKVLKVLGESPLAGSGELAVLEAASEKQLNTAARALTGRATAEAQPSAAARPRPAPPAAGVDGAPAPRNTEEDHKPGEPEEVFDQDDRAMQFAAAQLREVTDRRLGKVTPAWITALAREEPPSHTG